jgi:hypothetical protein
MGVLVLYCFKELKIGTKVKVSKCFIGKQKKRSRSREAEKRDTETGSLRRQLGFFLFVDLVTPSSCSTSLSP